MTEKVLIFSHANGFPAGCYRLLFEHWRAAGWRVEAVDRFGHAPQYAVRGSWRPLRQQLLDFIDSVAGPEHSGAQVALVGHSLGGLLSLMAASRRPRQVNRLVLLDSPVIGGWRAPLLGLAKRTGLIERVSPGQVSRQRRQHWPSTDDVLRHFQAKPAFARWDARVLADYVAAGFEPHDGQVALRFDRAVETAIYNTLPHHLPALLRRHPPGCPVSFIAGTQSRELQQAGSAASRALAGTRWRSIEGSHLYPFEKPEETASLVLKLLA